MQFSNLNFWHRLFLTTIMVDHYPLSGCLHAAKLNYLSWAISSFMLCSFGISTEASAPAVLSLCKQEQITEWACNSMATVKKWTLCLSYAHAAGTTIPAHVHWSCSFGWYLLRVKEASKEKWPFGNCYTISLQYNLREVLGQLYSENIYAHALLSERTVTVIIARYII